MIINKKKRIAIVVISLSLASIITIYGYRHFFSASESIKHSENQTPKERKVLFWYDPMYPNTKFDKPGKSPFMDMDLVPKYADEDESSSGEKPGIKIDPTQVQNLGMRTEKVEYGQLNYSQIIPATLDFNEHQYAIVQPRAEGYVEKIYPLTVGDKIKKGRPLIEITVPEWVEAQSEYLLLKKTGGTASELKGILERLRLSGMPTANINALRKNNKLQTRFTVSAPISGVITAFDIRTGMNVSKDKIVATIQGTNPIWVSASIPESLTANFNESSNIDISIPAFPEQSFRIQKKIILPSVNKETKTVQLRVELDNQDERLKPGMTAFVKLEANSQKMLLIPSQAVIDTGSEQRVITLNAEGRFVPKLVKIYKETDGKTAILSGLEENEMVVVSGLFMIDSEANISGALDRMRQNPQTESSSVETISPVDPHAAMNH